MAFSIQDLEKLNKIALGNPEFELLLKQILDYKDSDPNSSLTKLRTYLEKFLAIIFFKEFGENPDKPMIENMLGKLKAKEDFRIKFPRRIESRFKNIQDITNAAVHGEEVKSDDVLSSLDSLLEIGKWYFQNYEILAVKNPENKPPKREYRNKEKIFKSANDLFVKLMYKEAIPLLEEASELGDKDAPFYLGYLYREGLYVENDDNLAKEYFYIAIERGNLLGHYGLKPIISNKANKNKLDQIGLISYNYLNSLNITLEPKNYVFYCFILSDICWELGGGTDHTDILGLIERSLSGLLGGSNNLSTLKYTELSKQLLLIIKYDYIPALSIYKIRFTDLIKVNFSISKLWYYKEKNIAELKSSYGDKGLTFTLIIKKLFEYACLAKEIGDISHCAIFLKMIAEMDIYEDQKQYLRDVFIETENELSKMYLEGVAVKKSLKKAIYWKDRANKL